MLEFRQPLGHNYFCKKCGFHMSKTPLSCDLCGCKNKVIQSIYFMDNGNHAFAKNKICGICGGKEFIHINNDGIIVCKTCNTYNVNLINLEMTAEEEEI